MPSTCEQRNLQNATIRITLSERIPEPCQTLLPELSVRQDRTVLMKPAKLYVPCFGLSTCTIFKNTAFLTHAVSNAGRPKTAISPEDVFHIQSKDLTVAKDSMSPSG